MPATETRRRTTLLELHADETRDLVAFVRERQDDLAAALAQQGGVLFRGFPVDSVGEFQRVRNHLIPSTTPYVEKATPRSALGDDVFTSTEFPPTEEIRLHNENSYASSWPQLLMFGCVVAAESGGATPVADVRAVLERLRPEILDQFGEKGWMLVRNYRPGFGLPWQEAFGTSDRDEVERYCASAGVEAEWVGEGHLRTRQVRPALARHPETGDVVWFNHVRFWHVASLDPDVREMFEDEFGEDGLPYNTYFGDGSPIRDEVVHEIAAAYEAEKLSEPWREGDVMLLDNMLLAHGREPYRGDRKVLVSMGRTRSIDECRV